MSSHSSDFSAPIHPKRAGDRAEGAAIEAIDELEHVPDREREHVDARAAATIDPSAELGMVGLPLVEIGTLVEIKSALVRLETGGRGRFYLRAQQHAELVDEAAVYLFIVCKPTPDREILAMKFVPAVALEDVVNSWRSGGDDRPDCAQVRWGRIFDSEEVTRNRGGSS